jgi:branched-chain amino acid transport system substrate-binding protein
MIRLPQQNFREDGMKRIKTHAALGAIALAFAIGPASAQDKVKIGVLGQFSGPFATVGVQFKQGIETYTAVNGTRVGGREIELIYRDVGGPDPANAKRLAEELIVKDKVNMLAGFYLSPEGAVVAPLSTEGKVPTILFVAASPGLIKLSPYFIRVGGNILQQSVPPADWAIKRGIKRAYIAVSDYAPGHDVQNGFKSRFTALGGQIVGEDRIPLSTVDFAPYVERMANANPEMVDIFVPGGAPAVNLMKTMKGQGRLGNVTIMGQAEADDPDLHLFDDNIVGFYSSLYYAAAVPTDTNKKFKEALAQKFPTAVAAYTIVDAYDGMHVIYRMIAAQQGKPLDPDAAIEAAKNFAWDSPRGPVRIEPDTREVSQNIYIRRVEKVNGKLQNVIVDTITGVKDPFTR